MLAGGLALSCDSTFTGSYLIDAYVLLTHVSMFGGEGPWAYIYLVPSV